MNAPTVTPDQLAAWEERLASWHTLGLRGEHRVAGQLAAALLETAPPILTALRAAWKQLAECEAHNEALIADATRFQAERDALRALVSALPYRYWHAEDCAGLDKNCTCGALAANAAIEALRPGHTAHWWARQRE